MVRCFIPNPSRMFRPLYYPSIFCLNPSRNVKFLQQCGWEELQSNWPRSMLKVWDLKFKFVLSDLFSELKV